MVLRKSSNGIKQKLGSTADNISGKQGKRWTTAAAWMHAAAGYVLPRLQCWLAKQ